MHKPTGSPDSAWTVAETDQAFSLPTNTTISTQVKTETCDDAARQARELVAHNTLHDNQKERGVQPDTTLWIFLGTAASQTGPQTNVETEEFQRQWLVQNAGMTDGDKIASRSWSGGQSDERWSDIPMSTNHTHS